MEQNHREPIVELKGICKAYGDAVILDHLDLTLYRGEGLVIIGPSGTGKSTVLRIIAGLEAADAGEIYIKGEKRTGLIEDAKDPIGIGMVFQQAALFDSLSVEENVGFLLYQHSRLPRDKIHQLVEQSLEMVGLPGSGHLYPAELSGGMKKRISFARAIIANPENPSANPDILLYDEPTAGLDPIASTMIEDLVRHIQCQDNGCGTYVMVTHQHSTIRRTADRVAFVYQGKIQWQGDIEEIDTTDNPYVRQFFSAELEGPIQVASTS